MKLKENKKVLYSLIRTVGKLSNFYDEKNIYKCFLSNVYRYEHEKCDKYNEFLNNYLNNNVHYCPIRSKKKKLRSELIHFLRNCVNNDIYNVGFTAIRHLSRIKNCIINLLENKLEKNEINLLEENEIWKSETEKLFYKNNLCMLNLNEINETNEINEIGIKKEKKKNSGILKKSRTRKNKNIDENIENEQNINEENMNKNREKVKGNYLKNDEIKRINLKNEIKKGTLLIAHPLTSNNLWNRSVILITQKEKNNLVCGLILNKHPLYNNFMKLSNAKEIIKILNKLYLKKKKFLNEISENYIIKKDSCKNKYECENIIEKEKEKENIEINKIEKENNKNEYNIKDNENIKYDIEKSENNIQLTNNEKNDKSNEQNPDDFPTLKDLQEMFLRIHVRSSSKNIISKKIKKKNNFFIMMDEHLLDIITHYIIKLNKIPLYLRFLPSYNIGSITDIKSEIKKLEFLNEFYKIYFEKYNKWKIVLINNRVHIFDKEKNKENINKISINDKLIENDTNEERQLTEEEKKKIYKKIQKFKETNKIYNEEDEDDDDEEDDEEEGEEEIKEDDIDELDEIDEEENIYENNNKKHHFYDKQIYELNKENILNKENELNKEYEQNELNKEQKYIKKNINNYILKNPVSLYWLGGPLPALTILHNNHHNKKNIIIDDIIFEGYENNNINENNNKNENNMNVNKKNENNMNVNKKNDKHMNENKKNDDILIKRFIGKATWDLNQLIDELNNGFWIAINCNNNNLLSNIIFYSNLDDNLINYNKGDFLWKKLLSSLNNDYEDISKIPQYVIDEFLKDFKGSDNE